MLLSVMEAMLCGLPVISLEKLDGIVKIVDFLEKNATLQRKTSIFAGKKTQRYYANR